MTLATTSTKNRHNTDDTVGPFVYGFKILSKNDLEVLLVNLAAASETPSAVDTDFTVAGVGDPTGGSITFIVAPATADFDEILIRRKKPQTQDTDLTSSGVYPPANLEQRIDIMTMMTQERTEEIERAIKFRKSSSLVDILFPELVADRVVKVNATGDGFSLVETAGAVGTALVTLELLGSTGEDTSLVFKENGVEKARIQYDATNNKWKFTNTDDVVEFLDTKFTVQGNLGTAPPVDRSALGAHGYFLEDAVGDVVAALVSDTTGDNGGALALFNNSSGVTDLWLTGAPSSDQWMKNRLAIGQSVASPGDQLFIKADAVGTVGLRVQMAPSATAKGFIVENSGGGDLFAIDKNGDIQTSRTAAATSLGSVTDKLELFDAAGASIGFLPIYDAIT